MADTLAGIYRRQMSALSLQLFRGLEGLDALAADWYDLAARCGSHYLHFPAWYRQKLKYLDDDPDTTWFFAYFDEGRLVAVLPLKHESLSKRVLGFAFRLRAWSLYYPDEMGMCDATVEPAYRSAVLRKAVLRDLRRQGGADWSCLLVRHFGSRSHLQPVFAEPAPWQGITKLSHDSKYLATDRPYAIAIEDYSKKFRRNLRRKQNKLANMGDVRYRFVRKAEEIPEALEAFLAVEASGWKGEKASALLSQPHKHAMYRELVEEMSRCGNAGIHLLELDGKTIAGQLAVYAGSSIYLLKIGFDEDYGSVSPGFLLVNEVWRHACDALPEIERLSFVTGVGWINVWKPRSEPVHCAYCFRWPLINLAAKSFQWLKRVLKR